MQRILLALMLTTCAWVTVQAQRTCESGEYRELQLKKDPSLAEKLAIAESYTHQQPVLDAVNGSVAESLPVITIPVVVHVVYNLPEHNISEEQIQSQIDALNRDFRHLNADSVKTPEYFKHLAADCRFEFKLATTDPDGWATNGIVRRKTSIQFFSLDDRVKNTSIGGDDGWDPNSYLNIWVCNLAGNLMGYSSLAGITDKADGVVLTFRAFGTMGTANGSYRGGRTATHEVGHWLGLRHIWGDMYCGDDYVEDTPPQRSSSFGCPSGIVTSPCNDANTGNMYMNYMDLTSDACTNMFTYGQRARMRSLFREGAPRNALLSSKALTANSPARPAAAELPQEQLAPKIRFYPNPARNMVNIDISESESLMGQTVTIHNHLGQMIMRARISKTNTPLNIQSLNDGIYYIRVGGNSTPLKLVKSFSGTAL